MAACLACATWALGAQQPTFRSNIRVVPIYATVTGPDGRLLTDLTQEDFQVFDNGKPQPITVFSNEPVPITAVALWDVSNSQVKHATRSRAVARALVEAWWPEDRVRLGSFGVAIVLSPLLTNDKPTLRRIVDEELWFGGGTPIWTALELGVSTLARESGRRVLVVLTDADVIDNRTSDTDVIRAMHRADVMVYALGLEGAGFSGAIRNVAEDGGGGYLQLPRDAEPGAEMSKVVTELHQQYMLGFSVAALDGRAHSLVVRTRVPGAKVRARKSYIASEVQRP